MISSHCSDSQDRGPSSSSSSSSIFFSLAVSSTRCLNPLAAAPRPADLSSLPRHVGFKKKTENSINSDSPLSSS